MRKPKERGTELARRVRFLRALLRPIRFPLLLLILLLRRLERIGGAPMRARLRARGVLCPCGYLKAPDYRRCADCMEGVRWKS